MLPYQKIALVGRSGTAEVGVALLGLAGMLQTEGYEVMIEAESPPDDDSSTFERVTKADVGKKAQIVIVLGGDGTLLSIAREIAPYSIPLIGVNQGRLGFMTDIPRENMFSEILAILRGAAQPEKRLLLAGEVWREGKLICHSLALNDVVFSRGAIGSMIDFELMIDGHFVYSQRSDGLIVSTPTGSTAYALSSGGPILHPTLAAITLVPICPQSLSNRPIVVNADATVEFVLQKGLDSFVHFDGHTHCALLPQDRIIIRRYMKSLLILHPLNYNYYYTLRHKLHWGQPAGMPLAEHIRTQ